LIFSDNCGSFEEIDMKIDSKEDALGREGGAAI